MSIQYPQRYDDDFINIIKKIIDELNSMGYTYEESLQKAQEILDEAKQTNDMNVAVDKRLDNLIADSGTSSTEVVDARGTHTVLRDRLNAIDSTFDQVEEDMKRSYMYEKVYGTLSRYTKPATMDLEIPFTVSTAPNGNFSHSYDVSKHKNPVSKQYYVDVNNGDNNNPGTESEPFETLERAFRYGDADEIIMKEGVYDWSMGTAGTVPLSSQKNKFNLIADGQVILGAHRGYNNWTEVQGHNNVWHTSISSVSEVIDVNNIEKPLFYARKNSIEEVADTQSSFYVNGNDVYVRPNYNGSPDEKTLLNMPHSALELISFEKVYIEGVMLTNTLRMENANNAGELYLKNCDLLCATADNALSIWGDIYFEFQKCRAMYAERDGFNYHIRNGRLPRGIEVDCEGAFNGRDGSDSNNGSTMHDGGKIVRIGGEYHHNHGPNVIDVNDGTQSLNIGVHAHDSTATGDMSNVDFRIRDEGGGSDMWLVNCISHDSVYSTSQQGAANLVKENSLLLSDEIVL